MSTERRNPRSVDIDLFPTERILRIINAEDALVANAVGLVQDVPESKVRRGLASGVYNAAGDMGNILGPSIGGFIAHATGIASVFVVGSVGSTALFFLGVLLVRRMSKAGEAKTLASQV